MADDHKSAARLLRRDDIFQRVGELQQQVGAMQAQANAKALERYEVTAERIIGELARMGFANMLDYVRVTETGDAVVDLSALDRDKATAISEVVVDVVQDGKGEDAEKALQALRQARRARRPRQAPVAEVHAEAVGGIK